MLFTKLTNRITPTAGRALVRWVRFFTLFPAAIVVSIVFLFGYTEFFLTRSDEYPNDYNGGFIIYGTSTVFLTLTVIAALCLITVMLFIWLFPTASFKYQLLVWLVVFIPLVTTATIYAPPVARLEIIVYEENADRINYTWIWDKIKDGRYRTEGFSGNRQEWSIYTLTEKNSPPGTDYGDYECVVRELHWFGSLQRVTMNNSLYKRNQNLGLSPYCRKLNSDAEVEVSLEKIKKAKEEWRKPWPATE